MLDIWQDQSRWNLEPASKNGPRGVLFLVGLIAGRIPRSLALRGVVAAKVGSIGWHLRASQRALPRGLGGLRIAGGSGRLLLRLRASGIGGRSRHLKRDRHVAIDRQSVALAFGLRVQGRGISRSARKVVDHLRLGPRRRRAFRFSGRLFRARRKSKSPNRRESDEHEESVMEMGSNHGRR
jgi:hypothetical protein